MRQASLVITSVWPLKSILSSKAKTRLWFPFLSAHPVCAPKLLGQRQSEVQLVAQ